MRPRPRDTTVFGAVAELSAIEFLIAHDHSEVSSFRKKMSLDSGIIAVRATGSEPSVEDLSSATNHVLAVSVQEAAVIRAEAPW